MRQSSHLPDSQSNEFPKEFRKRSRDKVAIVPDCKGSVIRFAVFVGPRGGGGEPNKIKYSIPDVHMWR
jgi:hypothetical protein